MNDVKIDVNDYIEYGLGDIYYGLISFISSYVTQNYNPMEVLENENSKYSIAVTTMKYALKELLDYLKNVDEIYLPSLNRKVRISSLNMEEQLALEGRCKEFLISTLKQKMPNDIEVKTSHKTM